MPKDPELNLSEPPCLESQRNYAQFSDVLSAAGYSAERLEPILGMEPFPAPNRDVLDDFERRVTNLGALETLVKLFLCGRSVPMATARQHLRPLDVETLLGARVLRQEGDRVSATIKLQPYQQLLLASDPPHHGITDPPFNWVMGVGNTSRAVHQAMRPHPSRRALDIGTGSGILALAAADFCDSVLAIDRNPRAIGFVSFNARLNGISNVLTEVADLQTWSPEQLFDYVVSNPPFVLAPNHLYEYRSLGTPPQETPHELIRSCAARLRDDGHAHLIVDYPQIRGADWQSDLANLVQSLNCDARVQCRRTLAAEAYARFWIEVSETTSNIEENLPIWMRHLAAHQIERVTNLVITIRRRSPGDGQSQFEFFPEGPCE